MWPLWPCKEAPGSAQLAVEVTTLGNGWLERGRGGEGLLGVEDALDRK